MGNSGEKISYDAVHVLRASKGLCTGQPEQPKGKSLLHPGLRSKIKDLREERRKKQATEKWEREMR